MKTLKMTSEFKLILMSLVVLSMISTGCTSLQQTTVAATDDLYYTPNNKETPAQANVSKQNRNRYQEDSEEEGDEYQEYQTYPDDRYLRLKVANRNRWDAIDDFGYWNDPRFNYAYYPSYGGWNSWYSGFYGSSWYNPFGVSMGFGWGGYAPYNSYYSLGFGFNDFGYGGFGTGYSMSFGYGFGGGFGGWNPYFGNYWNPYSYYYPGYYGGFVGGLPVGRIHYQNPAATRLSAPGMAAYRNTNTSPRGYNNSYNATNGNTRYTGNANLNNNFGSLLKRVVSNDNNTSNANSWDRPVRRFNSGSGYQTTSNQTRSNYSTNSNNSTAAPVPSNNNAGGRSGGYNSSGSSTGGGRAPRNQR
jgi:hypothetical protein